MVTQATSKPFKPEQLHKLSQETASAKAKDAYAAMQKAEEAKKNMEEAFLAREPHPEAMNRLMTMVQRMAEQGKTELLVVQFPSSYLPDGGRRINNFEPDWPKSLTGFAKRAYDFYEEHLKQHGYKFSAKVLDFPGGMPGDIGIFLSW